MNNRSVKRIFRTEIRSGMLRAATVAAEIGRREKLNGARPINFYLAAGERKRRDRKGRSETRRGRRDVPCRIILKQIGGVIGLASLSAALSPHSPLAIKPLEISSVVSDECPLEISSAASSEDRRMICYPFDIYLDRDVPQILNCRRFGFLATCENSTIRVSQ